MTYGVVLNKEIGVPVVTSDKQVALKPGTRMGGPRACLLLDAVLENM